MLDEYANQVCRIARQGGSEAKLQGELDTLLREMLRRYGIDYDPYVNETFKALGFSVGISQIDSLRPDSLFGHVVLDYKKAGVLSVPRQMVQAKEQVEGYLNTVSGGHDVAPDECQEWAGVLWDGFKIIFCHSDGTAWRWSRKYPTSAASLLTLVQTYRSLQRKPLTAEALSREFGKNSAVAQAVLPALSRQLSHPQHRTNMLFQEWRRLFEQVSTYTLSQLPSLREWARSHGIISTDASQILFALHTYYSIVVKLLTSELLAAAHTTPGDSLVMDVVNATSTEDVFRSFSQLEDSDFYRQYRISNFLEGDFFSWYVQEREPDLAQALVLLARTFQDFEPATAKLRPETIKDLLKQFYTSVVDEQIRHDLGEYYTADWLAQHVLDQVAYDGDPEKVAVDASCGSGTFLVESIVRVRVRCEAAGYSPLEMLDAVVHSVRGLDLNPLAIISARANYILAIADLVFALGHDIEIPVYLADAINVPVEEDGVLKYKLDTMVGELDLEIPLVLVQNQVLGKILLECEHYIERGHSARQLINHLRNMEQVAPLLDEDVEARLRQFYVSIEDLNTRKPPWDSIWCRVVKNNFSPRGFGPVDYIVGNVPWVRWSRLPSTYRKRVKRFCDYYGLVSGRSFTGGIESDISTVLAFSTADHWLTPGGKMGILITWTVFKSDSARGFRVGRLPDLTGLRVDSIEDLTAIQPFPDATNETGLYLATKVGAEEQVQFDEIPCRIWKPKESARIDTTLSLPEVKSLVEIIDGEACPVADFGSPLWTGSIDKYRTVQFLRGSSPYLELAHRGTVTDLARLYWVKVEKYVPETNRALIRTLREEEFPRAKLVEGTEGRWIEADLLYPVLRGRETGRYDIKISGWYQIIPNRHYRNVEPEEEFMHRYKFAHEHLMRNASLLKKRSSYKRYMRDLPSYCIWCVGDYSFAPYKVAWPEQQDPNKFRASVVTSVGEEAVIPNRVIVPDHKLYFVSVDTLEEAHYLCAFLNSRPVRTWLGGFQLGKQIGTTIFEFMRVPRFDPVDEQHLELAAISREAHRQREGTANKRLLRPREENQLEKLVKAITSH